MKNIQRKHIKSLNTKPSPNGLGFYYLKTGGKSYGYNYESEET